MNESYCSWEFVWTVKHWVHPMCWTALTRWGKKKKKKKQVFSGMHSSPKAFVRIVWETRYSPCSAEKHSEGTAGTLLHHPSFQLVSTCCRLCRCVGRVSRCTQRIKVSTQPNTPDTKASVVINFQFGHKNTDRHSGQKKFRRHCFVSFRAEDGCKTKIFLIYFQPESLPAVSSSEPK